MISLLPFYPLCHIILHCPWVFVCTAQVPAYIIPLSQYFLKEELLCHPSYHYLTRFSVYSCRVCLHKTLSFAWLGPRYMNCFTGSINRSRRSQTHVICVERGMQWNPKDHRDYSNHSKTHFGIRLHFIYCNIFQIKIHFCTYGYCAHNTITLRH